MRIRGASMGQLARAVLHQQGGSARGGSCPRPCSLHTSAAASGPHGSGTSPLKGHDVVAVVQGSDRGIGLQFVEQLLSRYANTRVVATCRDPEGAGHLGALQEQSKGRLHILPVDVTQEDTIKAAAEEVKSTYGHVNLLINCSGIFHVANVLQPESAMRWLDPKSSILVYQVNALGPMLVTKHFTPLLEQGALKHPSEHQLSVVANLSSKQGSISDNAYGGWYSYRASKAALNQFTKTAAMEYETQRMPVVALCLYPGTVDTDLSRPYLKHTAPDRVFTTEFAVTKMLDVIEEMKPEDNGKFIAWDKSVVPW